LTPGGVGEKVGGDKPVGHQREGVVGKAGVLLKKMRKTLNACNFYQMLVVSIQLNDTWQNGHGTKNCSAEFWNLNIAKYRKKYVWPDDDIFT